jgi:DNA-binding phage protein
MGTPAQGAQQAILDGFTQARDHKQALSDAERQTQLASLSQAGLSPEAMQKSIRLLYQDDPSALRQHVGNLVRRISGQDPAPDPAAARGQQIDAIAATGTTPEQRAATAEQQKFDQAAKLQQLKNAGVQQKSAGTRPVPGYSEAVNLETARSLGSKGQSYVGADGKEIDLSALPDGVVLVPVFQGGGGSYWTVATDRGRYQTAGNQRLFEPAVGGPNPNAPSIGAARVPTARSSTTTDPFGITSTTNATTTPMGAPAPGGGQGAPQAAPVQGGARPRLAPRQGAPRQVAAAQPAGQLDADGHIPAGVANPMLSEAANQLLDGMDIGKLNIPQRDKQAAAQLASKYGWAQGGFTPRELTQVKESQSLIADLSSDPKNLSVYSSNPIKRALVASLIRTPKESGFFDSAKSAIAAGTLAESDLKFIQNYRQLIGRIQGLAQLTRGSGRSAEAAVNRMIGELPDPTIVNSPELARNGFRLVQQEIDIALKGAAPKSQQTAVAGAGARKVGEKKTFKNGKTGVWDGTGWVAQ